MTKGDRLTLDQLSEMLSISYWAARGLVERGELKKVKIGGRVYVLREEAEMLVKKIMAGHGKK